MTSPDCPPQVITLLDFIDGRPSTRFNDLPADLAHDPLRIALHLKLLDTSSKPDSGPVEAARYGSAEALERIRAYIETINPEYWMTSLGRYTLGMYRLSPDKPGRPAPARRKPGPRPKEDLPSKDLLISALSHWHGYSGDGSVTNLEPATNRSLAAKYRLASNSLTRFFKNKGGISFYHRLCRLGSIGQHLKAWRLEFPTRGHELGSAEDKRNDQP